MTAESDRAPVSASVGEMLQQSGLNFEISTEVSPEELLNGTPSRHFPEKRGRRSSDSDEETIARLYAALEAIDRGEIYTGEDCEDSHLLAGYYRQF